MKPLHTNKDTHVTVTNLGLYMFFIVRKCMQLLCYLHFTITFQLWVFWYKSKFLNCIYWFVCVWGHDSEITGPSEKPILPVYMWMFNNLQTNVQSCIFHGNETYHEHWVHHLRQCLALNKPYVNDFITIFGRVQ